jgi:hypothetical protein
MSGFLSAHGYDPGPTQRPLTSGAIGGVLATAPAIALLYLFGSLAVETRILGLPVVATIVVGSLVMALAGAFYARLLGRAANDVQGGWLFGMAFGFVLWAIGAVFVLPIVGNGQLPAGPPAIGVLLSLIFWGGFLGALLPFVQRCLQVSLDEPGIAESLGPSLAVRDPSGRSAALSAVRPAKIKP